MLSSSRSNKVIAWVPAVSAVYGDDDQSGTSSALARVGAGGSADSSQFVVGGGSGDFRLFDVSYSDRDTVRDLSSSTSSAPKRPVSVSLETVVTDVAGPTCVSFAEPRPASLIADSPDEANWLRFYRLAAVGSVSGKVHLTCFPTAAVGTVRRVAVLTPKHARPCVTVAWNTVRTPLLAAGFEKVRNGHACVIWDVNRSSAPATVSTAAEPAVPVSSSTKSKGSLFSGKFGGGSGSPVKSADGGRESGQASSLPLSVFDLQASADSRRRRSSAVPTDRGSSRDSSSRPQAHLRGTGLFDMADAATAGSGVNHLDEEFVVAPSVVAELAHSEAAVSMSWVPDQPASLAVGMGVKWLRIYDLRAANNLVASVAAHPKAVLGVSFDPFHGRHLLSYSDTDSVIKLWDVRRLIQPLVTIQTNMVPVGGGSSTSVALASTASVATGGGQGVSSTVVSALPGGAELGASATHKSVVPGGGSVVVGGVAGGAAGGGSGGGGNAVGGAAADGSAGATGGVSVPGSIGLASSASSMANALHFSGSMASSGVAPSMGSSGHSIAGASSAGGARDPTTQYQPKLGTKLERVAWCPTRSGVIATASKSEQNVKLWDLKDALSNGSKSGDDDPMGLRAGQALLMGYPRDVDGEAAKGAAVSGIAAGTSAPGVGVSSTGGAGGPASVSATGSSSITAVASDIQMIAPRVYLPLRVQPTSHRVAAFAWHPTVDGSLLALSPDGQVEFVSFTHPVPLAMSSNPNLPLAFAAGGNVALIRAPVVLDSDSLEKPGDDPGRIASGDAQRSVAHTASLSLFLDGVDISQIMHYRATGGYSVSFANNVSRAHSLRFNGKLIFLWRWLNTLASFSRPNAVDQAISHSSGSNSRKSFELVADSSLTSVPPPDPATIVTPSYSINSRTKFRGICSLIFDQESSAQFREASFPQFSFPVFQSWQRAQALALCGWCAEGPSSPQLGSLLEQLERQAGPAAEHGIERAVALAVFALDFKAAIRLLNRAGAKRALYRKEQQQHGGQRKESRIGGRSDSEKVLSDSFETGVTGDQDNFQVVAMALAGHAGGALWKQTCRSLSTQIRHPYLQACFTFLAADKRVGFRDVLDSAMELRDRVGFALRFLNNSELARFLQALVDDYTRRGDLEGVQLTGLYANCVDLLQTYVDRTGDVQTAALLTATVVPRSFVSTRALAWIANYRNLLDRWQMWTLRAEFDVIRAPGAAAAAALRGSHSVGVTASSGPGDATRSAASAGPGDSASGAGGGAGGGGRSAAIAMDSADAKPHVYARCGNCQLVLSLGQMSTQHSTYEAFRGGNAQAHAKRLARCCPGCSKPLPRCSVCLMSLDVSLPGHEQRLPGGGWASGRAASYNKDFISWCTLCRHGGHADHLLNWFAKHKECPVLRCNCHCNG